MSNDTQSPGPNPPNHTQVEVHPGWVRSGRDDTPGRKAYYINLEAKPGKGDKVEQFLRDILAWVEQEPERKDSRYGESVCKRKAS
jgi:hypothetical protein